MARSGPSESRLSGGGPSDRLLPSPVDRSADWLRWLLYGGLVVFCVLRSLGPSAGSDLLPSFVACRLLAAGEAGHLYDFHPQRFELVESSAWLRTAAEVGYSGVVHPYVQTPLLAWVLRPLCASMDFVQFKLVFAALSGLACVALVAMVARSWASRFRSLTTLAILLLAIVGSMPFQYAACLGQTHVLFLALAVGAMLAAERGDACWAGCALAIAAAVKVTPGLILVYWLAGGRYRSAGWFVVWSAALAAATVLAVGIETVFAYLQSLRRIGDVLLVSYNNQSLAAWWAQSSFDSSALAGWQVFPLPVGLKLASLAAALGGVIVSGVLVRGRPEDGTTASMALLALTAFAPIAWTHYYLVLVPAVMVLGQRGGIAALAVIAAVFILNTLPVAVNPVKPVLDGMAVPRSHFFSAVLAMAALGMHAAPVFRAAASAGKLWRRVKGGPLGGAAPSP